MRFKKYTAIHDYISNGDLLEKLGYREYKPKIGVLGRAIMEASKNHRSVSWLKKQLDSYFNKLREDKHSKGKHKSESKKRNRHPVL